MDHRAVLLIAGILLLLIGASAALHYLRRYRETGIDISILDTCRSRVQAWWVFFGLLACALILGTVATVIFFFIISFWALREYITLTPTRPADHKTLFSVFFIWTPLQYILVGLNDEWFLNVFGISCYQVYSVLIPVYAFLILPACIAISGDSNHFLERVAKLQVGLVICVYSLSFAPALLTMTIPNETQETPVTAPIFAGGVEETVITPLAQALEGVQNSETAESSQETADSDPALSAESENADQVSEPLPAAPERKPLRKRMTAAHLCLLFFFIFVVQMSDIFQYLWSQFFRRGVIAKTINMNKTWGGVIAGSLSTSLLAMGLWYFTPFPKWWQPLVIGFVVSIMGFAGSITLSAIKRDRGVADYGHLIEGHDGVLDRIDSICFAAPVFFHLVWVFLHLEIKGF